MKRLTLTLIYMLCFTFCSKSKEAQDLQSAPKTQQIIIDKGLGQGTQFMEFLNAIRIKNCAGIISNLDDSVILSFGEGIEVEFIRRDLFKERKRGFTVCDLLFETKELYNYLEDSMIESSSFWLGKSSEIRFIAMDETSAGYGKKVNVALFGGRYSKPNTSSRDVDFMFRCPIGFNKKCFLYYVSYEF